MQPLPSAPFLAVGVWLNGQLMEAWFGQMASFGHSKSTRKIGAPPYKMRAVRFGLFDAYLFVLEYPFGS